MRSIIPILILLFVCSSYGQATAKADLSRLNAELAAAYKSKDLDAALGIAVQVAELSSSVYGKEHFQTGVAIENVGIIYQEKKKYREALDRLENAKRIFETDIAANKAKILNLISRMSIVCFQKEDKKCESIYLSKALEFARSNFGPESKETLLPTMDIATRNSIAGDFDSARVSFLSAFRIASLNFGPTSKEVDKVGDAVKCAYGRDTTPDSAKYDSFTKEQFQILGIKRNDISTLNKDALFLYEPAYPKYVWLIGRGKVIVKVMIGEDGLVEEARSICGVSKDLAEIAEKAAMKCKFRPTIVDGKPVKTSGAIEYNFGS
ncbi:MAG: tetratricopeptide repeat protein [Pyrinomonadaceae bacterium]|nr:tetratricopeptide repeat protein [Acidobacteriota bacterium]MBK7932558.1 tetratricopeptide repeat protein [Acidobacteriota bacterium]MBP7376032.1 tetratricopeptide repeat protein [Pyrinomonadaceae bacterium]